MEESRLIKFVSWIEEDVVFWDETSRLLVPEDARAVGKILAKAKGVVAGVGFVEPVLWKMGFEVTVHKRDGETVEPGDLILELRGNARKLLEVGRVLLNVLMHASGVATATRRLVVKAQRYGARVAATRKTLPGLRALEKMAVMAGGGDPHRLSLSDAVLIKKEHLRFAGGVREAVMRAREGTSFTKRVEVEVETPEDAVEAARAGADIVMLDNFSPEDVRRALDLLESRGLRDRVIIEVSGGISEDNVEEYARLGVDVLSSGSITHSARALDMSMEVSPL